MHLRECSDAKEIIGLYGRPSFSGIRNIKSAVSRANMGGVLNMRELLDIASLLKTARVAKGYEKENFLENSPVIAMFSQLGANKYLEDRINAVVISEEEIADSASAELSFIRRHIRQNGLKIKEVLNKTISSPQNGKMLQEPIVTTRGDRYVVPVRSEYRSSFSGLVHDISSSGATVFMEPMQVVELNNELAMLNAREKREIERILAELSDETASFSQGILDDYELLCRLDFIFAKAELSFRQNALAPMINDSRELNFKGARHPLIDKKDVVPIDIRIGRDFDALIITGPNTGGKTVSLKTLGLLTLMAQCGLHIPCADGSIVAVYDKIYADIGDEQSIEQSLSTFSSHMKNIVEIHKVAGERSLVLLDELGAGTDPVEGAALAIAIIEQLRQLGATVAATTHYAELKAYALTEEGVENASCEFDIETLRPTYKLLIGVAGKSNAFAVSEKLGLSHEIIKRAESLINSEDRKFEDVLTELEKERQRLAVEKNETEKLKRETRKQFEDVKKTAEFSLKRPGKSAFQGKERSPNRY